MTKNQYELLVVIGFLNKEGHETSGILLRRWLIHHTGRDPGVGHIYTELERLRCKGWITRPETDPNYGVPGGRRRKISKVTEDGLRAVKAYEDNMKVLQDLGRRPWEN